MLTWIAGGFIASGVKGFVSPSRTRSDFHRVVEAVIYTAVLIWFLNQLPVSVRNAIRLDLEDGISPNHGSALPVFFLLAAAEGYLCGRMVRSEACSRILRHLGVPNKPTATVWMDVLSFATSNRPKEKPSECGRWVTVYLDDGTTYLGWPSVVSSDPDGVEREICLDDAWLIDEHGDKQLKFERVYIPGKSIRVIEIYPLEAQSS